MSNLIVVDEERLEIEEAPRQVWILVRDAVKLITKENPKKHDVGALMESISRFGYQEVAKYDATISGIKAGNGRIEALALMERDGHSAPRGIAIEKVSGAWAVPVTIGVDAISRSEGLAYLIDSNNLVMSGGDFDGFDMARLWNAGYVTLLGELDELPVSVDADTLAALCKFNADLPGEPEEQDEPEKSEVEYLECPACGHKWPK